jgi:hypothetical protein
MDGFSGHGGTFRVSSISSQHLLLKYHVDPADALRFLSRNPVMLEIIEKIWPHQEKGPHGSARAFLRSGAKGRWLAAIVLVIRQPS